MGVGQIGHSFFVALLPLAVSRPVEFPPDWLLETERPVHEAVWDGSGTATGLDPLLTGREPVVFRGGAAALTGQLPIWEQINGTMPGHPAGLDGFLDVLGEQKLQARVPVNDSEMVYLHDADAGKVTWASELFGNWSAPSSIESIQLKDVMRPAEKRSMHATLNLKSGLSFMCEDDAKLAKAMTRQGEMKSRWNQSDDNEMKEIIQNCFGNLWAATSGTLYDPHYDLTQNLQLQLHGRKRWVFLSPRHFEASGLRLHPLNHPRHRRAYGWAADAATARATHTEAAHVTSVMLDPGDLLFIPSYTLHMTNIPEGESSSLSQSFAWSAWPELWDMKFDGLSGSLIDPIRRNVNPEWARQGLPDPIDRSKRQATFITAQLLLQACLGDETHRKTTKLDSVRAAPNLASDFAAWTLEEFFRESPKQEASEVFPCWIPENMLPAAERAVVVGKKCKAWFKTKQTKKVAAAIGERAKGDSVLEGFKADSEAMKRYALQSTLEAWLMVCLGEQDQKKAVRETVGMLRSLHAGCQLTKKKGKKESKEETYDSDEEEEQIQAEIEEEEEEARRAKEEQRAEEEEARRAKEEQKKEKEDL